MAMTATVEEIADAVHVTEKTVRDWIRRHGCPVVQEGRKGQGNGALIDAARFPAWYAKHAERPVTPIGGYFREHKPGHNPLREMHDIHRRGFMWSLANMLDDWANARSEGPSFRTDGLTQEQAHAVAFRLWGLAAMTAISYQTRRLDKDIDGELSGNLDDWFSILTAGSFRTRWTESRIEFPPKIQAMAPPDVRAKLEAMAGRDEDEAGEAA